MLSKNKTLEILNDWNFWRKEIDTGIERTEYLEKMERYYKMDLVVSLIGIRRSGKSTLMLQFAKKLITEKKVSKNNILYVNFEDSRFLGEHSIDLLNNIYEVYLENLAPSKKPVIFLDEIQNIEGWEKFVRSLNERKEAKIFVSGSNAHLLSSEFSAVLTGRQLTLTIYPLAFEEFLLFNNIKVTSKLDLVDQKAEIKRAFAKYLQFGGMPKQVLLKNDDDKFLLLRNYFEDILNRDLIGRFKIRQTEKLKEREEKRIKTETDNPSIRIEKASKVKEWYKNNPEKVKEKSQKMVKTKRTSIDENGLNIYQRTSQKISIAKRNFHKKSKDVNTTNDYFLYIINHLREPIIKIGITNDLKRRLRDIKTDFGKSEIIFNIKSPQNKIDELETYLHDYFNEYCKVQPTGRGRTEWFDESILEEAKEIITISSKEFSHTVF